MTLELDGPSIINKVNDVTYLEPQEAEVTTEHYTVLLSCEDQVCCCLEDPGDPVRPIPGQVGQTFRSQAVQRREVIPHQSGK